MCTVGLKSISTRLEEVSIKKTISNPYTIIRYNSVYCQRKYAQEGNNKEQNDKKKIYSGDETFQVCSLQAGCKVFRRC